MCWRESVGWQAPAVVHVVHWSVTVCHPVATVTVTLICNTEVTRGIATASHYQLR